MPRNENLLDQDELSGDQQNIYSDKHQSAKTFMIIMAILWGLLLFVDLFFLMIFNFFFAISNGLSASGSTPMMVHLLFWNFLIYPILFIVALVGGFQSLGKRNYSSVYTFGLLPAASVVFFFILIAFFSGNNSGF